MSPQKEKRNMVVHILKIARRSRWLWLGLVYYVGGLALLFVNGVVRTDSWQSIMITGLLILAWCQIMVNFHQHRLNALTGERLKELENRYSEDESDSTPTDTAPLGS